MKRLMTILGAIILATVLFSSCTTLNKTMREPNVRVNMDKNDFSLSNQVSAEATTTTIFGIDFERLFAKNMGTIGDGSPKVSMANIPVIGSLVCDKTTNYALYELMKNNPGYDVVFYPQYEVKVVKPMGLSFLLKTTTVKATAKLGKLK